MRKSTNCRTRQNSHKQRSAKARHQKARAIALAAADADVAGNWYETYKAAYRIALEVCRG